MSLIQINVAGESPGASFCDMNMKTMKFGYVDDEYEVRAESRGTTWTVQVYKDGRPANRAVYTVSWDDTAEAAPPNLAMALMQAAKQDFLLWSDWSRQAR